ncbi:ABC transporter [Seiridium cupressi]
MRMVSNQSNFSVATAVTCLSILNLITSSSMQLLLAIPMGAQAVGSFARIQSFLQLSEAPVLTSTATSSSDDTSTSVTREKSIERDPKAPVQHAREPQTCDVTEKESVAVPTLAFTPNSLIAITGSIGCGKSTLLKRLLTVDGEQESCMFSSKDIAYCSQTPWIYEGTIRDNIIGQSDLDSPWYQSVIRACELDADIGRMPEGDAAAVGSGGSKLSGGQRQRIAIARALYSRKERMIFDDVTSALDSRTLSAVVDNVFGRNGILRSKGMSAVLATHAVRILQLVDEVLLMGKDGKIIDSGTYEQLAERHQYFVQRQVLDSSDSPGVVETPVQGKELEVSLGEYQTQLQTRVDDLRRRKGDWRSYGFYLGSMGWLNFSIFVMGALFYVVFTAIFGVWLTWWAEDTAGSHGLGYWLGLYATWAILIILGLFFTPIFFFTKLASKASKVLHTELLATAMRFSQDIRLCDWQLPLNILLTLLSLLACLASIGIAVAAVPYMAIAAATTSRKPYYLLFCVQRWLILVLALIVMGIEVVVIGLGIALRSQVSPGLWTEMETSLGAVSRTYRFTHETPREDHLDEQAVTLPEEWPSGGSITFENVSATYNPHTQPNPNLALNNITFSVKPGETVGICGRTGSGKSSLMAALLRLLPCHQGRILIDGLVTSTMGPEIIRSKLNCVTQEPFLLDGKIRENLTPWGDQASDEEMTQALEQVDLWSKVVSLGGLDALLADSSLSHGQRQLFCLARALLRKSSILVLDEPTGHIDPATDATIQRIIREGFPGRTIIMIAHRLESLVEFDTVMVLDSGRLVEIGPPRSLLNDSSSSFSALYRAGENEH